MSNQERRVTFELVERISLDVPLTDVRKIHHVELIPDVELFEESEHYRLRGHLTFTAEYATTEDEPDGVRPHVLKTSAVPHKPRKGHVYYRIPVDMTFGKDRVDESGVELIIRDLQYELLSPSRLFIRAIIDLEGVTVEEYLQPVRAERDDVVEVTSHWRHPYVSPAVESSQTGGLSWIETADEKTNAEIGAGGDAEEVKAAGEPAEAGKASIAEGSVGDTGETSDGEADAPAVGEVAPAAGKDATWVEEEEAGEESADAPTGSRTPTEQNDERDRSDAPPPAERAQSDKGKDGTDEEEGEGGSIWLRVFGGSREERRQAIVWHFVQPEETLEAIAERYGVRPEALRAANERLRELRPGMRLSIPAAKRPH